MSSYPKTNDDNKKTIEIDGGVWDGTALEKYRAGQTIAAWNDAMFEEKNIAWQAKTTRGKMKVSAHQNWREAGR